LRELSLGELCTAEGRCVTLSPDQDSGTANNDSGVRDPGYNPGPGVCPKGLVYRYGHCVRPGDENGDSSGGCATGTNPAPWWLLLIIPLFLLIRRRFFLDN